MGINPRPSGEAVFPPSESESAKRRVPPEHPRRTRSTSAFAYGARCNPAALLVPCHGAALSPPARGQLPRVLPGRRGLRRGRGRPHARRRSSRAERAEVRHRQRSRCCRFLLRYYYYRFSFSICPASGCSLLPGWASRSTTQNKAEPGS